MAQADGNVAQAFQNLADEMGNVSIQLGAQGISQIISPYEGEPKKFKEWVKSIEKYAVLTNCDNDRIKRVAYQSSRGPVSDFIRRYQDNHPNHTWNQMKEELTSRFSEVVDQQHAYMLLRKVHQKLGETVQVYAERLITLAEEAFPGPDGPVIQRQLIDIFLDGLSEDHLKMKILRENLATLEAAIEVATNEQNIRRRFNLRTHHQQVPSEEHMEVDHYRPAPRCFKCNKKGHKAKDCRVRPRVNAVESTGSNQNQNYTNDKVCWYCRKKGHFKRDCRKRQADLNGVGSNRVNQISSGNQEN